MDQSDEGNQAFLAMMMTGIGGGLSRTLNSISHNRQVHGNEQSLSNQPEELCATNDGNALRMNEVDSGISLGSSSNTRGGVPIDDDQDGIEGRPAKRKRLQRLTSQQAHILEGFFSICAHPDESQRKQLSETTGLKVQQVKFWFQNKRTQVKHQNGKEENYRLKVENDMLKEENKRLKQSQKGTLCPNCINLPAHNQLVAEVERLKEQNAWLQQEFSRMHNEIAPNSNLPFQFESSTENVAPRQNDTEMIAEVAKNAMHELVVLAESNAPLWLPVPGSSLEILNKMAYYQTFAGSSGNDMGFKTEATRAESLVMLDPKNIVDFLMDAESYGTFCPGILFGAKTTKVYKWPTNEGYDEAMQSMTIEMVFPSPLVPSRKCTFMRFCRELEEGTVVVADVSLDDGDGTFSKCRKMPSGVVIQSIRPNCCKVTVIEHVRVDGAGVHDLYQPCLSGLMFGARRWVTTIARQCARMRDVFHVTNSSFRVGWKGRKTLMKLADDLLVSYARGIATDPEDSWTILRGTGLGDDIKVAYRRNDDGANTGVVSVCSAFRLPLPLRTTYDLLRNNVLRSKWDVLVSGGAVKEEVRVSNGVGNDDAVTIVHVKHGENRDNMMILQNSSYDVSGSFMIYAPIDSKLMDAVLSPGDMTETKVSLHPTGFSLIPDGEAAQGGADLGEDGGTLMTVGFQVMLKLARGSGLFPQSVSPAINLMADNIADIKRTLTSSQAVFYRRNQPDE